MKEVLLQYAQYNIWANKRIIDTILEQPPGSEEIKIVSSFPSIRATVYHMWSAESIWLQRLQRAHEQMWQETVFFGTFEDGCGKWEQTSADMAAYVAAKESDADLKESISYFDRGGRPHTMQIAHILHHALNHATYHRGQLVTMLRQVGATKIPDTDFIDFATMKI